MVEFGHDHYVPCLRWKMGEYQALLRLSAPARESLTPCIEVPEIGFDFETRTEKKSIDDHLAPFAKKIQAKWRQRSCFVDLKLLEPSARMRSGQHSVEYVFDALRTEKCHAVPVTGPERDISYQDAVRRVIRKDGKGLCLRIGVLLAERPDFKSRLDALLQHMTAKPVSCDLIIDLGAPSFNPIDGFGKVIQAIILKAPYLANWRTLTLMGSSVPESMAEIKSSMETVQRSEWLLYKKVAEGLRERGGRIPTFGDYTINHPHVPDVDMRLVKPAAKIWYTVDGAWLVVKGPNVRDNGFEQYRQLCRTLMKSTGYVGSGFSAGSDYITDCAGGAARTGNLTTWRWVGTNHHLEKVVRDVASFHVSLGNC